MIELRKMIEDDFDQLYQFGLDHESSLMAKVHPRKREDFFQFWAKVIEDPNTYAKTILYQGRVVGLINAFPVEDETHVGYWIDRAHWGKGIGKRSLAEFLKIYRDRPVIAVVANTNIGSIKILESCAFKKIGELESEETDRYMACTVSRFVLESA